ncbi:Coenzyme F420 hydrogenase/dehydrogenase, beta subunit C-terminal domain [bacterium]|nr:Coenzyme F420 hydrogenase/dehydrogenase, beta subunit C-terminal domain [bacterium]
MKLWDRPRDPAEVLGVYRRILLVGVTDEAIAGAGQDGGLGTAMLQYALDHDYIDAALVSKFDTEQRPRPGIARTREDLLASAGSRYTYSPNLLAIAGAERTERLGVISVGCQTSVPVIARSRGANKLAKRFALVIGLLCSKTFSDEIYDGLLEATYGVPRRSITKVNIKGRLQVWHDADGEPGYLEVPLKECREFSRPGCSHCPDFAAQHADVSLGGIGKHSDRTLTVTRTDLGEEFITAMERDGLITIENAVTEDPDAIALIEKLATFQRRRWKATGPERIDLAPAATGV